MTVTLICPSGHTGYEGDRWCTTCGSGLMQRCRNGHLATLDERFCVTCGVKLEDTAEARLRPAETSVGTPISAMGMSAVRPTSVDSDEGSRSWVVPPPTTTSASWVPEESLDNWEPDSPPDRGSRLAPDAGLAAAGLLVLAMVLPPAWDFHDGHPLWKLSIVHFSYQLLRHPSAGALFDPTHSSLWALLSVLGGLATVGCAWRGTASRSRGSGAALSVVGGLTAIFGVLSAEVSYYGVHAGMGIGSWGVLIAGVMCLIAGLGMTFPDNSSRTAGSSLAFTAIIGSVIAAVAGIVGMTAHINNASPVAYTPPSTDYTEPTEPSSTEPPSTPAGSLSNVYNFTATQNGGYTFSGTLSIGSPQHLVTGLQEGNLTAGSACSINSENDAVIPAILEVQNTTSNFNAYAAITLAWSSSAISGIEVGFTGSPQCETGSLNVNSNSPAPDGSGFTADMFIVVPQYFTPNFPNGKESLLSGVTIQIEEDSSTSEAFDVVPQTVSGPGSTSNGGLYVPVDPNAPAPTQTYQITTDGTQVMSSPSTSANQVDTLQSGITVAVVCTTQGDAVQSDTLWDKISSPDQGYVPDAYVNTDNGTGIPSC